jgi:hypothetical protein
MAKIEPQRRSRKSLKSIFQKGKLPTEASFSDLIDSTINIIDDGINKSEKFGYELSPQGEDKSLLSFFKNLELGEAPIWQFAISGKENEEGLSFGMPNHPDRPTTLFFDKDGHIGVNTLRPVMPLSVDGFIGLKGRIGIFAVGEVAGDGQYHNIIENVINPESFEIVARIDGAVGRGKYAMTHAIALCTYPNSWFNKVKQSNAFFGWPWNRIKLRWKNKDGALILQMKTSSHYGIDPETNAPFKIRFHISKLWDDTYMKTLLER